MSGTGTSSWTAQATVTASLTAFLYEGFTYNAVYLGKVLPAVGKEDWVVPLLVGFNLIWGMALWSYLRVSWADPGALPEEWYDFVSKAATALPIAQSLKEWQPRRATLCKHCLRTRPERAHHCALCGVCIMRLDHHCPWINNCVGFSNHKFFLLTCFYALVACLVAFFTALPDLWRSTMRLRSILHGVRGTAALEPTDEIAFLVFGMLACFAAMFLCPLFVIQMRLALANRTTIEDNYDNMPNPYDQGGPIANLSQIFGRFGPDWLVPTYPCRPTVDGISFPNSADYRMSEYGPLKSPFGQNIGDSFSNGMAIRGRNWALALSEEHLRGEELWAVHYQIASLHPANRDENKISPMDYMFGCMQMDCEGGERGKGYI